jgi:predicted secreted protein
MDIKEDRLMVRTGEEFEVNLPTVPSSGHDWHLVTCPLSLEFVSDMHVRPVNDAVSIGEMGAHTFRFRATAEGSCSLSFVFKRPWEKRGIRKKTFQVTISD